MKKLFICLSIAAGLLLILAACNLGKAPEKPSADIALPTSTSTPEPTPTVIQHRSVPSAQLPEEQSGLAGDQNSAETAVQKHPPGGDRFTYGRFERPFNANTMDTYFPELDIQAMMTYQDATWFYTVITLKGTDQNQKLSGRYAVEIDSDLDGRGDWLVLVERPESADWSTSGVQVWTDADNDVGGETTINADESQGGNGYEKQLFNQGQGDDPDLAWARISSQEPNVAQIAFKQSLLAGDKSFLAGVWAGHALLDPALFDINDHFTHEQAGEALPDLKYYYPIKAVYELDNTCRVAIGFKPTGSELGMCPLPPEKGEPESDCPSGKYYCNPTGAFGCVCLP